LQACAVLGWRGQPRRWQSGALYTHDGCAHCTADLAVDNSGDAAAFRADLINIARTTLSSKIVHQDKDHFANLAVDAVLRLKGSTNIEMINVIKKLGGSLTDSYLDEGYIMDKKIGVNQPKRIEKARILIANTPMDTDKIKVFGAKVRVDATAKVAEIEAAERVCVSSKPSIRDFGCDCDCDGSSEAPPGTVRFGS
jgi:T-complex protein 1 subunit beta